MVGSSHMAPFTLKLVKIENGNSAPQPREPHVRCWGAACGWGLPYWRAQQDTPRVLDVTAQLVDGSLGHHCPTTDLSAVSSHPLHLILLKVAQCLLCRSSESVMTHSCLNTSVGD